MLTIRGMTSVIAKRHLVTVAANANTFKIPVIDFSKFKNDKSPGGRQQTAEEVVTALKGSGFIYLENHGISSGMSLRRQQPSDIVCTTQNRVDMIRITFQKVSSSICTHTLSAFVDEYISRVLNSSNSQVKSRYVSYCRTYNCQK